ncbi:MAG: helix-turn-helix domain-containing protein [Betaproteobacteria bacterium]
MEKQQLQCDLLASVRQMKRGRAVRVTPAGTSGAAQALVRVGLPQRDLARLSGVSVRALRDWEQGRREPSGVARALLPIAASNPRAVLESA